jgi:hypothetical protein
MHPFRKASALTLILFIALGISACIASTNSEESGYIGRGLVSRYVDSEGSLYTPEGSRLRGDLLDISKLIPVNGSMMIESNGRVESTDMFTIDGASADGWRLGRLKIPQRHRRIA